MSRPAHHRRQIASAPRREVAEPSDDFEARVESTAAQLRAECIEKGYVVTGDGRIAECNVDAVLKYSEGWIKNLRHEGAAPPHYPLGAGDGSRVSYRLCDVAEWLEKKRNGG
jgi:hypothetical protein